MIFKIGLIGLLLFPLSMIIATLYFSNLPGYQPAMVVGCLSMIICLILVNLDEGEEY